MASLNRFLAKSASPALRFIKPTNVSTRQYSSLLVKNNLTKQTLYSSSLLGVRFNSTETTIAAAATTTPASPAAEFVAQASGLTTDAAQALVHPALQLGDLKAMGLVNYTPVGFLEATLEAINVFSGLPWWGTIALTTVIVRVAMLPIIVKLQKASARFHNVKPEMESITKKLERAKETQDPIALQAASSQMMDLYKKHNINPLKILALPMLQAPVMISFFIALRDMSSLPVPQFLDGGLSWFTNLAVADPTWALPVLSSLGFLAIMELGSELGKSGSTQPPAVKNFLRLTIPLMTYFTLDLPSAVHLYWICSNFFSVVQILTFNQPAVRAYFGIPQLKKHPLKVHDPNAQSIWARASNKK
jgi:YidC/Oxa1 family membrane protein insertase